MPAVCDPGSSPYDNVTRLMPTVLLIDAGSFFVRRIFSAVEESRDGFTGEEAVETVVQSVIRLILRADATYALCAFDSLAESTWHQALAPVYAPKSASLPERYKDLLLESLEALNEVGIRSISVPGLESEDVLASVCRRLRREQVPVQLVTNSLSLVQLVDAGVTVVEPFSDNVRDAAWLDRRLGILPKQIPAYFALAGTRGRLCGVPGIGPKRAGELLREYQTLERVLAAANEGALPPSLSDSLSLFAPSARIIEQLSAPRDDIFFGLNVKDLHIDRNLYGRPVVSSGDPVVRSPSHAPIHFAGAEP